MRAALLVLFVTLGLGLGCAATSPPPVATSDAAEPEPATSEDQLPAALEELSLSTTQRRDLLALREQLERDVEPLVEAGRGFVRAVGVAAERCKPDSPYIDMEASFTVRTGEQVRGKVLDGINRFHALLTPAQRRALSQRMLDTEERNRNDRNERRDESRTRSLGDEIGLSFGQILTMLVRVQAVRGAFEDRIEGWRAHYRSALRAFARDDFDIRRHAIAQAPVVEIATDLVRDLYRVLIPVLEPDQCKALARFIADKTSD